MKGMLTLGCLTSIAALAFGSVALAQPRPDGPPDGPGRPRQRQQARQRDDGPRARPDASPPGAPGRNRLDRIFNALDADGDGKIDRDEFTRKSPDILKGLEAQRERTGRGPQAMKPDDKCPARGPGDQARPDVRSRRREMAPDRQGLGPDERGFAPRPPRAARRGFGPGMQREKGPGPWCPYCSRRGDMQAGRRTPHAMGWRGLNRFDGRGFGPGWGWRGDGPGRGWGRAPERDSYDGPAFQPPGRRGWPRAPRPLAPRW